MTEWGVVVVLISLVGLATAIGKPILALNTTITKLTAAVDELRGDLAVLTGKNTESHRRLWEHNEEQDKILGNHEGRIKVLENRKENEE